MNLIPIRDVEMFAEAGVITKLGGKWLHYLLAKDYYR